MSSQPIAATHRRGRQFGRPLVVALRARWDSQWFRRTVIGCAVVIVSLARSWQLGVDSNWDLLNYHLYKSTAVFDGSLFSDVAPSGLGTFLNPLIELPVGLCIELLGTRRGLLVGVALVQVACFVAIWRLASQIALKEGGGRRQAVVMTALIVTGSCAVSVGFTTFGDWPTAALLCESLRSMLRASDADRPEAQRRRDVLTGAWAGFALGLKLTVAPMLIGLGVACLVVMGFRRSLRAAVGVAAGFVVSGGAWMLYLQIRYSSPTFPFFNGFFGAPGAPERDFDDPRFGAANIRSIAEFPVEMLRGTSKYSEYVFQDWRFIAVLAVLAAWVCVADRYQLTDRVLPGLSAMVAVGFLVWVTMFGIYRYFLLGEILASIILVMVVFRAITDPRRATAVCIGLGVFGLGFQQAPDWGRDAELSSPALHAAVEQLPTEPSAIVLSAAPPLTYLLDAFPSATEATSLWSFEAGDVLYAGEVRSELDRLVSDAADADGLYAITDPGAVALLRPLEDLTTADCAPFTSNGRELQLCRVVRP